MRDINSVIWTRCNKSDNSVGFATISLKVCKYFKKKCSSTSLFMCCTMYSNALQTVQDMMRMAKQQQQQQQHDREKEIKPRKRASRKLIFGP